MNNEKQGSAAENGGMAIPDMGAALAGLGHPAEKEIRRGEGKRAIRR